MTECCATLRAVEPNAWRPAKPWVHLPHDNQIRFVIDGALQYDADGMPARTASVARRAEYG